MPKYFGKREEGLIREYIKTRDEKLYEEVVDPLLTKIAYGVRSRYNFQPARYYRSNSVIGGCKILMWEKLITNFDPNCGKKSYSYLTRCAHNFFCGVWRKRNKALSTQMRFRNEVAELWYGANQFEKSGVQLREENERAAEKLKYAKDATLFFLKTKFGASDIIVSDNVCEKILAEINSLPKAHKKAVNAVLIKYLFPKHKSKKKIAKARYIISRKKEQFKKVYMV